MELKGMTCPKCGATLNFTEDRDFCFCSHCGTQVYKEDKNNPTITYQEIDQAKIKDIELKNKKFDYWISNNEKLIKLILLAIVVAVAILVVMVIIFGKEAVGSAILLLFVASLWILLLRFIRNATKDDTKDTDDDE